MQKYILKYKKLTQDAENTGAQAVPLIKRLRLSWKMYVLIAPFTILFFTFTVLPVLISIFISFTSFNVLEAPNYIGLSNYFRLFLRDEIFTKALANTLVLAVAIGPVGYLLSLIMAWLINELPPKIRAFITLLFYAPAISGNVYLIWTVMFSGDQYGYLNSILLRISAISEPINFLKDPRYMIWIVIIVALWSSLGTSFLAFIAGFQGVDKTMYEAGAVDGVRNRWQELWFITLPSIKPQMLFGAVMSITGAFSVGAICTALAGFPSAQYAVHTIMNHLDDYGGIRYEMGYASAIATILFMIMFASNMAARKIISNVGK